MGLTRSLMVGGCLGVLGFAVIRLRPPTYVAQGSLYLPTIDRVGYKQITASLGATPAPSVLESHFGVETAQMIFQSESVRKILESKHVGRFVVTPLAQAGLHFELRLNTRAGAQSALKEVWTFYQSFVDTRMVTQSKRAYQMVDSEMGRLSQELANQEKRLSLSRDPTLHALGESASGVRPEVLAKIRLRRVEDERVSQTVLTIMRQLRELRPAGNDENTWLSEWATSQKKLPGRLPTLNAVIRSQDLPERVRLERTYYDTLLEYRALLLQRSFLRTAVSLENLKLEVLDPIEAVPLARNYWPAWVLALIGMGVVWASEKRR